MNLKYLTFSIIFLASLLLAPSAFAQTKIAVVDMKDVMQKVPDGKKAMKKLQADLKSKQDKLEKAKKDFEAFEAKLAKKSATTPPTAAEQKEYQEKYIAVRTLAAQSQEELNEAQLKIQQQILAKVQRAAEKVAKSKSLDLIIMKEGTLGVLYSKEALDITQDIIKNFGK